MVGISSRPDCQPWVTPAEIQWQTADMTVTIGSDVPYSALDQSSPLWLAIDCHGRPDTTVGRLVERNSTGPLRIGFGGWRDLLLGCQFLNGRGQLITAGGRTFKNVAGYDLTKLMVGQSGVLGRVAAVILRAYRRPDDALLAEWNPSTDVFNRLLASPCRPQWAVLTAETLTCGWLGDRAAVDYYARSVTAWQPRRVDRHGTAADAQWRCAHWKTPPGNGWVMRASVRPARVADFTGRSGLKDWVADPAFGVVLAEVHPDAAAAVARAAWEAGGRAWFWNDRGELAAIACSPNEFAVLQRLKHAMDPDQKLAPLPAIL
jgi:FAD/FMN-containing dehydrogenase